MSAECNVSTFRVNTMVHTVGTESESPKVGFYGTRYARIKRYVYVTTLQMAVDTSVQSNALVQRVRDLGYAVTVEVLSGHMGSRLIELHTRIRGIKEILF